MNFRYNEMYDEIPKEVLNTNTETATGFVCDLIKSVVPPKDYNPKEFSKAILPIKPVKSSRSKVPPKKSYLTKKLRNKLKLSKCPKTGWNYEQFKPLREMWQSYMKQSLAKIFGRKSITNIQNTERNSLNVKLAKADYHGAEMKIIRSTNPSLVGISGTCIIDTKNTFKIVSKDNKCRTIPKQDCIFEMEVESVLLTVFGKLTTLRPADRSVKKIKALMNLDL